MSDFDLVIRHAMVATAADVFRADIGVQGGKVAALGLTLPAGAREIDAAGLLALPGGIDAHCHLDQPSSDGSLCADDFESGSIAAACGGTTTIIPFALQLRGQSLRAAVADYHRRAAGKAIVDYAFHLIISDPTEQVTGQELPALIRDGYTSFKISLSASGSHHASAFRALLRQNSGTHALDRRLPDGRAGFERNDQEAGGDRHEAGDADGDGEAVLDDEHRRQNAAVEAA
jgi:dihydroorotase-like cyclic amidohydrolase